MIDDRFEPDSLTLIDTLENREFDVALLHPAVPEQGSAVVEIAAPDGLLPSPVAPVDQPENGRSQEAERQNVVTQGHRLGPGHAKPGRPRERSTGVGLHLVIWWADSPDAWEPSVRIRPLDRSGAKPDRSRISSRAASARAS